MYSKNTATPADPALPRDTFEPSNQKKIDVFYGSDSYQKILDYHVVEILLSTIVIAVIVLLRLHR